MRSPFVRHALVASFCALLGIVTACGGSSTSNEFTSNADGGTGTTTGADGGGGGGGGGGTDGGSGTTTTDSGAPIQVSSADGTAVHGACTGVFGSALTSVHGRLDGKLVSIVSSTQHGCNNDSTHLHLQIEVAGAVYDAAVNVDGLEDELDSAVPGGPWTEGWHANVNLDYPTNLAVHSPAFTLTGISTLHSHLTTALANANHISMFGTGYGPTGMHLIHRQGSGRDGAIVIDPLSPTPHVFVFRFSTDSF